MSHTNSSIIESDPCTPPYFSQGTVASSSYSLQQVSEQTLPSPPCTPSPSSSLNDTCQRRIKEGSLPLTAAGLGRGTEVNQGQSLSEILNISTLNPSHLFWVPASQHPELAPTEFEKYVTALRANAKDKGKVKRRRSVLSVSFTADDDDTSLNDDDDKNEGRRSALENQHPQSLDSNTPEQTTKARKDKLRRSMSLPGNKDQGKIPEFLVFDRNSTTLDQSPVLVPKTDRPLSRRGARTRFQRTSSIAPSSMAFSDSHHRWSHYRHSNLPSDTSSNTPSSTDNIDTTTQEQGDQILSLSDKSLPLDDPQIGLKTILSTITKELQQDDIKVAPLKEQKEAIATTPPTINLSRQPTPKPSSRERKSSWSWSFWSDDKKTKAEQPSIGTECNEAGTLPPMITSSSTPTSTQRFGLSSLFSRKSSTKITEGKTATTIRPPKDFTLNKINHHHRLPIHMERAVYKLSHIKLANPRRPLRDQVLISNFMFWYLSIVSHQQQAPQNSKDDNPPSPQQIGTIASKKKKKRLTRKSEQQPSNQKPSKHIVSSYQQQHPSSSPPPSYQHTKSDNSWQSYTTASSKQQSTGFVVPNDYLHPDHKNSAGRQARSYSRRNSSSSSSEEDDDDKSPYNHSPHHPGPTVKKTTIF